MPKCDIKIFERISLLETLFPGTISGSCSCSELFHFELDKSFVGKGTAHCTRVLSLDCGAFFMYRYVWPIDQFPVCPIVPES